MRVRSLMIAALPLLGLACGRYDRVEGPAPAEAVSAGDARPDRAARATVLVVTERPQAAPVLVVPVYAEPAPALAVVPPPPPPVARWRGTPAVTCSGDERIRVHNRHVIGGDAPAVVATGNCVVEISESILRGAPAVWVEGNARVSLVECRVFGDLVGGPRITTRGTAHEQGRAL